MANNYKVKMVDLQNKYKFKIFCSSQMYDDTDLKREVEAIYKAFPKASSTGTSASLDGTAAAIMNIDLKGNTSQNIYDGKNLYDFNTLNSTPTNSVVDSEGWITASLNNTSGTTAFCNFYTRIPTGITIKTNTVYTAVLEVKSVSYSTSTATNYISISNNNANYIPEIGIGNVPLTNLSNGNVYKYTLTTKDNLTGINGLLRTFISVADNNNVSITYRLTLVEGDISIDDFVYQPFTGGKASPSPDYPQAVNVVTGDNTITIANSDNTESQSYNVNLGSLELCKIGNYQDYIYKTNKWYLHKEIYKTTLRGGSETWTLFFDTNGVFIHSIASLPSVDSSTTINCYTNYYNNAYSRTYIRSHLNDIDNACATTGREMIIANKNISSADDFKTWLSNNNVTIYYVLATPTTTEITDTDLIAQLEALKNAESYAGTTNISQVNDDLPFIITASAIKDLSNL